MVPLSSFGTGWRNPAVARKSESSRCRTSRANRRFPLSRIPADSGTRSKDRSVRRARSPLNYLEGKATVLVSGELRIDPEIAPLVLADRFHIVHNLGDIRCTPGQMGAIEARLGIHEGELLDSTPREKETFDIGSTDDCVIRPQGGSRTSCSEISQLVAGCPPRSPLPMRRG